MYASYLGDSDTAAGRVGSDALLIGQVVIDELRVRIAIVDGHAPDVVSGAVNLIRRVEILESQNFSEAAPCPACWTNSKRNSQAFEELIFIAKMESSDVHNRLIRNNATSALIVGIYATHVWNDVCLRGMVTEDVGQLARVDMVVVMALSLSVRVFDSFTTVKRIW